MSTATPLLTVIIPTFNRIHTLKMCLSALDPIRQSLHKSHYHVIVTNDNPNQNLKELLSHAFPWVQFLQGPHKGPAANRNEGATYAQTDWMIFIDDDCIPNIDCLEKYYQAITANPDIDLFEGAIYADRPRLSLAEEAPINDQGNCFWSCNLGIRKSIFQALKGFDEAFPYAAYEDMDFAKRLKQAGYKTQFLSKAAVCHPWRTISAWKKFWRQRKSALIYIKKNPDEWPQMNGWMTLKIAIGRLLFNTFPGLIQYQGKGFCSAVIFDLLDIGFGLYLFWVKPQK